MVERTTPAGTQALVDYVLRETRGRTYSDPNGRDFVTDVVRIIGRKCLEARERAHELGNRVMALEQELHEARAAIETARRDEYLRIMAAGEDANVDPTVRPNSAETEIGPVRYFVDVHDYPARWCVRRKEPDGSLFRVWGPCSKADAEATARDLNASWQAAGAEPASDGARE